jgi:hypothetical protein
MTPETTEAVRRDGVQMGRVSAERLRDEFFLMLAAPHPSQPIRLLDHLSLLVVFLPQLYPQPGAEGFDPQGVAQIETGLQLMSRLSDILGVLAPSHDPEAPVNAWVAEVGLRLGRFREPLAAHLARVIRGDRTARQLLYLGGLLQPVHAMNKRAVQDPTSSTLSESTSVTSASIGDHLRLSRRESQTLGLILENSIDLRIFAREGQPDASWAHRYFREAGSAGVEALLLSLAVSIEGSSGGLTQEWRSSVESVRSLFEAYFEHFDEIVDPQSVIRGEELIRHLGLSPGPLIGKLLRAIRVAQAEGTVKSRADALAYARKRYMELED